MTLAKNTIAEWAQARIDEMLAAPRMWGSREAVELQALSLIEMSVLAMRSDALRDPRYVIDAYHAFLTEKFPNEPAKPLYEHLGSADETVFVDRLREFQRRLVRSVLPANPFQHSDLAILLTFQEGRSPSASAFTGYYEKFRRSARAMARAPEQTTGRPGRVVEGATDFTLEDVRVTPMNGVPASALLLLGSPQGQQDFEATRLIQGALSEFCTMVEWADSGAAVAELRNDDVVARTHTALQSLRMLPSRDVKSVEVGGRLIGRTKPIQLRAEQEERFVAVVAADAGVASEPFDKTDEVRAIDFDRGTLRLGKKPDVAVCYVRPEHMDDIISAGTRTHARVVGTWYRPLRGAPFVLATSVTVIDDHE